MAALAIFGWTVILNGEPHKHDGVERMKIWERLIIIEEHLLEWYEMWKLITEQHARKLAFQPSVFQFFIFYF